MAVDIIATTAQYWMNYVFGSNVLIAGVIVMFFIMLWGMKQGWNMETFVVLFVPLIFLIALPPDFGGWGIGFSMLWGLIVIGAGLIIGYAIINSFKRN